MTTIISPSLLSCDFLNLTQEIQRLNKTQSPVWLHLDIMDGHYVPNLTFGPVVVKNLSKITQFKLDAHFMVTNPELHLDLFKNCGLHNFTFHYEVIRDHLAFILKVRQTYPSCGISINPETPVTVLNIDLLKNIDLVLIMSVSPGFGGQSFQKESIEKVRYLQKIKTEHNLDFIIQVDGGINNQNSHELIAKGANNLVAGNFIFSEPNHNYESKIKQLL